MNLSYPVCGELEEMVQILFQSRKATKSLAAFTVHAQHFFTLAEIIMMRDFQLCTLFTSIQSR